jgi:hypothetical protein
MRKDFDLISKSSLQQSQIEKMFKSSNFKKIEKKLKPKESPSFVCDTRKLDLFNEIYLFGLSKEKEFKTVDCLWEYINPNWKKTNQILQKVKDKTFDNSRNSIRENSILRV